MAPQSATPPTLPGTGRRFNPHYILPGTNIGGYVIRERIRHGAAQVAYLAEATGPAKREVVLKVSLFQRGKPRSYARMMHERFRRQLTYLLYLEEVDGVAHLITHGMYPDHSSSGFLYLVQEWVEGNRTIVTWAAEEPHPLLAVVRAWAVLADACGAMGRFGIAHRDLTDDNILVTPSGIPKIIDFNSGVGPMDEPYTVKAASQIPGKPWYFSPEQCTAILRERETRKLVPFASRPSGDLYAMGVNFYRMLTGDYPFNPHLKGSELYEEIATSIPPRPRELNPEVPFGLEKVTLRLLEKEPEKRYQSGEEVVSELLALLRTEEDWNRPFQTPGASRYPLQPSDSSGEEGSSALFESSPAAAPVSPSPGPAVQRLPPSLVASAAPLLEPPASAREAPLAPPLPIQESQDVAASALPAATGAEVVPPSPGDAPGMGGGAHGAESTGKVDSLEASASANAAPSAMDGPVTPGKSPSRWRRRGMLAALVGALAVALASAALSKEGTTVLSKAGSTMVAAVCSVLGCAELTGRVRPQDKDWLDQCPAHKREVWRTTLEPPDWGYGDFLEKSPDVIRYRYGAELRSGPVVVTVTAPGITMMRPRLYGDIRTGSDGASLRFNKMTLIDGREFEICAIAAVGPVGKWGPGFPIMPAQEIHRMPDSELHPEDGFVYVVFGAPFNVYFAK